MLDRHSLRMMPLLCLAAILCLAIATPARGQRFSIHPIPDSIRTLMTGRSLPANAPGVNIDDLRYLLLTHYTLSGDTVTGELVVNKRIAHTVCDIFRELYRLKYPVERMSLIDHYDADDERSMRANNTSAFCYRRVAGTARMSKHSQGLAIDINPLYNPCFRLRDGKPEDVQPSTALRYTDRSVTHPCTLNPDGPVVALFKRYGFVWGGDWRRKKDYQHFEK